MKFPAFHERAICEQGYVQAKASRRCPASKCLARDRLALALLPACDRLERSRGGRLASALLRLSLCDSQKNRLRFMSTRLASAWLSP